MEKTIKILYVEDVPEDAELILREILINGINFTRKIVCTKKDYVDTLISFGPDLIISDYSLPAFNGMNALSLRNEIAPLTPFILVTGSANKEVARECIKAGADDYILKSDLSKLLSAIKTAFLKRDALLISMHNEPEPEKTLHRIKEAFKAENSENSEYYIKEESRLKDYDMIEEKLTFLDMALKSAGIGTWVFDLIGDKRYFDDKACHLLGFTSANYKRTEIEFLNCIHPDDREEVKNLLFNAVRKKADFETDFRVIWPDGAMKFLTARAKTLVNNEGIPVRLNGLIWDITDHKILQITLQENIRKTNSIINNLKGAVFRCLFDKEMTMEFISEGIKELSGYNSWDFLMNRVRSFGSLIHEEDRSRVSKTIRSALKSKNPFTVEFRLISSNGDIKWVWEKGSGVFSGSKIIALEGYLSDITDRKKTEEELKNSLDQLHQLTQYIEKVREGERIAISRELHDDLGQALTAVKIDLGTIKQSVYDSEVLSRIDKVSALVSSTIKTVQRLTSQLRPQIIDDLGLEAAIEWYTKEFEQRSKIAIVREIEPSIKVSSEASLIIFRIMQEALTNIARHAGASKVVIVFNQTENSIVFSITDNGIGISEKEINAKKSFGIISMKERAASLGGTFYIYSDPGGGTVVKLIFPSKQKEL